MIKSENLKIVQVSFVLFAFLVGFVVQILFETLAVTSGFFARYYGMEVFRHGIPIACGLAFFLYMELRPSVRSWADEVVTEVRKVVWPTKKELYAMTFLVCTILIGSGLVLGFFDFFSGTVVRFFME